MSMSAYLFGRRLLRLFKIILMCSFLTFLSLGCSSKTQIVLLPDSEGKVGRIEVTNPKGAQTLDQPWQSAEAVSPDKAPSEPKIMDEAQVRSTFREALAAQPKPSVTFLLYFQRQSAEPTAESLKLLPDVLKAIKSHESTDISIVGHADSTGPADYNLGLSLRRARKIADILVSKGVDRAIIEIDYFGKGKPLIEKPEGVPEPRNRRVEITIR
jgi:outer membrane protein OmpA-like peptidoglycan-associated protein